MFMLNFHFSLSNNLHLEKEKHFFVVYSHIRIIVANVINESVLNDIDTKRCLVSLEDLKCISNMALS